MKIALGNRSIPEPVDENLSARLVLLQVPLRSTASYDDSCTPCEYGSLRGMAIIILQKAYLMSFEVESFKAAARYLRR